MLAAADGKRTNSVDGGCWLHGRADQQHHWRLLVAWMGRPAALMVAASNGDMMMVVSLLLLKACAREKRCNEAVIVVGQMVA